MHHPQVGVVEEPRAIGSANLYLKACCMLGSARAVRRDNWAYLQQYPNFERYQNSQQRHCDGLSLGRTDTSRWHPIQLTYMETAELASNHRAVEVGIQ